MALANTRYNIDSAWFSDMRVVGELRNLIFLPIDNHDELGMSLFSIESKLQAVSFYPGLFAAAFGSPTVTRDRIAAALAQFLQSMISYQSKSDLANSPMENVPKPDPATVLTPQEVRGLEIFNGKCTPCHEDVAATNIWHANNGLDAIPNDHGTTVAAFQRNGSVGVFRAASLRNIAVSGPYMHDGRFSTLRQVIDHYSSGIQPSQDLDGILRDWLGSPVRFNLSESDKTSLEAFLNTFTDYAFLSDPKFSNPFVP
jgi:cytochrome c peroxidase